MGSCRDCRSWRAPKPDSFEDSYYDEDQDDYVTSKHGLCQAIPGAEDGKMVQRKAVAFTMDMSGCASSLYTLPNFGCVLFQPKVPEPEGIVCEQE